MKLRTCMNAMAVVLGMAAASAHATQTFCVDSVNEFDVAYETADEENVIIQLVRGTYDMTGSCIDSTVACPIDDDITIRGGYAPGCGSRTLSAVDTVLTRPGGGFAIETSGLQFEGNGDVVIESLTVRDVPQGFTIRTETANDADAYVSLRRLWFDQTGGLSVFRTAEVAIRQSLISRTTAPCAVRIENTGYVASSGYLERATLFHVTIADSSGDGLCIGDGISEDWSVSLMNSIVWDTAGDDIVIDADGNDPIDASLYNNTFSSLISSNALSDAPGGSLSSNPQFVNPAAGDFELGGTSTSINSAFPQANVANDRDLKGDPRLFSIAADRGALESSVGSTATTLVVTNIADSGIGSLRQALLDANSHRTSTVSSSIRHQLRPARDQLAEQSARDPLSDADQRLLAARSGTQYPIERQQRPDMHHPAAGGGVRVPSRAWPCPRQRQRPRSCKWMAWVFRTSSLRASRCPPATATRSSAASLAAASVRSIWHRVATA